MWGSGTLTGSEAIASVTSLLNVLIVTSDALVELVLEESKKIVEITKALAALQPLYGKDNIEITTRDGRKVRGIVRSMKTTQALTTPSVKMKCANGDIVKIVFPSIVEIRDFNTA